jgi:methionyl-tRNA synthetase
VTIVADILAQWNRLCGKEVFFLTGLDENSIKTVKAAKEKGITDIQSYTDSMAEIWENVWKSLKISNDDFIRTTETRHRKTVVDFFNRVYESGDIYKGKYEGLYCDSCEQFLTDKDLIDGCCPYHNIPPNKIVEENYFFKLTKYQQQLIDYIHAHPNFIQPESRRNEVISFLNEGLQDVSISRPNLEWGINLPIDATHVFWVWFDALANYISANPAKWPATVQLVGKDILRFHCILWPAFLLSAEYELPSTIFAHGFYTINGQKVSKSLGNAIDPVQLSATYGIDPLRYFLVKEIPFGNDGDFSEAALIQRINSDLADNLGNLVNRVLVLVERKFKSRIPSFHEPEFISTSVIELPAKVNKLIENFQFHNALNEIWRVINEANKFINDTEPWAIEDEKRLGNLLYSLLETLRFISILISPFLPETAIKMRTQLGISDDISYKSLTWGKLVPGQEIKRGQILFTKFKKPNKQIKK